MVTDLDIAGSFVERILKFISRVHRGDAGRRVPSHTQRRRRRRVGWGFRRRLKLTGCSSCNRLHGLTDGQDRAGNRWPQRWSRLKQMWTGRSTEEEDRQGYSQHILTRTRTRVDVTR